jgi:hypothetical protein
MIRRCTIWGLNSISHVLPEKWQASEVKESSHELFSSISLVLFATFRFSLLILILIVCTQTNFNTMLINIEDSLNIISICLRQSNGKQQQRRRRQRTEKEEDI